MKITEEVAGEVIRMMTGHVVFNKEMESGRMGVMEDENLYRQIVEAMPSLELCTVIPRASRLWKEIVEDKYFRFVIQIDEGKEDMCSIYVEKEGEILRLRGEAEHEMKAFSKPTKVISCVNDVMLVQQLLDKRLFVVHQVIKNKRFEVPVALRGEDDSFGLVHTGKALLILHLWDCGMGRFGCKVMNLHHYYKTRIVCWFEYGVDDDLQVDLPFSFDVRGNMCTYWFVGSRYVVELDDGGHMQIMIRQPASQTYCYMIADDYSLKQFQILNGWPSDHGYSAHACLSNVSNTQGQGAFTTKVCLENPTKKPSLFFLAVPKVIFGGRYVILLRGEQGNKVFQMCYLDLLRKSVHDLEGGTLTIEGPEFYEGISQVLSSFNKWVNWLLQYPDWLIAVSKWISWIGVDFDNTLKFILRMKTDVWVNNNLLGWSAFVPLLSSKGFSLYSHPAYK
ncbi:hypothetical protein Tco_1140537 [Tanacetum coccineum]